MFTSMHFVSSEYDSEKGNTIHFIRKLTKALFLRNLVVSGSSLHEFEVRFSLKNLLHQFKKWRNGPEITKKLFSVLFLG